MPAPDVTIRAATIDDVPALVALRRDFWASQIKAGLKDGRNLDDEPLTAETTRLVSRPRTCILLGSADGTPAAYVFATVQAAPHLVPPVVKTIEEVFVAPSLAGTGMGARLSYQAFEQLMPETPAREQIRVLAGNVAGRAFWRKLGFEEAVLIMERDRGTWP